MANSTYTYVLLLLIKLTNWSHSIGWRKASSSCVVLCPFSHNGHGTPYLMNRNLTELAGLICSSASLEAAIALWRSISCLLLHVLLLGGMPTCTFQYYNLVVNLKLKVYSIAAVIYT